MNSIYDAVSKLIDVKSLVTIALTIGFIVQSVRGQLDNNLTSVYLVVISFYFGTQYQKQQGADTISITPNNPSENSGT